PVAVPSVPQVRLGSLLEAATGVEASRQLVGERLVLNQPLLACRLDGRFVQTFGVQLSAFDAGDLSVHQFRAALARRKTVTGICLELPVVLGQRLDMLAVFKRGSAITGRRMTERAIEMSFRGFKVFGYHH